MEIALTISAVIGLVNTLIRVFRNISKWLKARDPLFKENSRMIKILKAHFDHNNNPSMSSILLSGGESDVTDHICGAR